MTLAEWHDLFVACAGAASALAGLIIVAMSVNIDAILAIPSMTSRAATAIAGLMMIVVLTCAGLVPHQSLRAFGIETVIAATVACVLAGQSAVRILRSRRATGGVSLTVGKASLGLVPALVALAGGVLLCAGQDTGLDVLAAAIITGFATATTNAWVLLVEIRR